MFETLAIILVIVFMFWFYVESWDVLEPLLNKTYNIKAKKDIITKYEIERSCYDGCLFSIELSKDIISSQTIVINKTDIINYLTLSRCIERCHDKYSYKKSS